MGFLKGAITSGSHKDTIKHCKTLPMGISGALRARLLPLLN